MSLPFFASSQVYCLLDIRSEGVYVEFVRKERAGLFVSLAHTSLAVSPREHETHASSVLRACKEMSTQYPQFKPQFVIVFLHSPHTVRKDSVVTKRFDEQILTGSTLTSLIAEHAPSDDAGYILVHDHVAYYLANGYRVFDPRGKRMRELTVGMVRIYVTVNAYTSYIAPVQDIFGAPVRVTNFNDALISVLTQAPGIPHTFSLLDIGTTSYEYVHVDHATLAEVAVGDMGCTHALDEIMRTSELTRDAVMSAMPLLHKKTLEDALARRLIQGVEAAAQRMRDKIYAHPTAHLTPLLILVPETHRVLGELLVEHIPYATILPPGDMPALAGMVEL